MSFALACAASIATVGFLAQEQRGQHHSQLGLEQPSGLFTGSEATPSSSNSKSPAIIFSVLHAVVASAVSLVLDVIVIEFTVLAVLVERQSCFVLELLAPLRAHGRVRGAHLARRPPRAQGRTGALAPEHQPERRVRGLPPLGAQPGAQRDRDEVS